MSTTRKFISDLHASDKAIKFPLNSSGIWKSFSLNFLLFFSFVNAISEQQCMSKLISCKILTSSFHAMPFVWCNVMVVIFSSLTESIRLLMNMQIQLNFLYWFYRMVVNVEKIISNFPIISFFIFFSVIV